MAIKWRIEKRNIDDLKGYEKNPRKFTDKGLKDLKKSLENCGDANIITINKDNTVLGGHARLTVMKQLGYKEVDVKVPDRLLNDKECQEIVIRLNANTAGEWDFEKLEEDFDTEELEDWGLDGFLTADDVENDNPYTMKVEIPVYEPKTSCPAIETLCNQEKCNSLIKEIEKANIPDDIKEFLKLGAYRHLRFSYKDIAEFYCHQNKEVQELMERSALVIIDFDKAIENGYVKFCKEIYEFAGLDYEE